MKLVQILSRPIRPRWRCHDVNLRGQLCTVSQAPSPHSLRTWDNRKKKSRRHIQQGESYNLHPACKSVWQHWLILPDRSQSHMWKQERINKELAGSLRWKKKRKKKKKKSFDGERREGRKKAHSKQLEASQFVLYRTSAQAKIPA